MAKYIGCAVTAKEYLSQAHRIDQRINSKLEQVKSLRALAEKAASTLSVTKSNGARNATRMQDIITKMVDLEAEINTDINTLVDLKREISTLIKRVDNLEFQTLLELRYLCFMRWEEVAVELNYSSQYMFRIHSRALEAVARARGE